MPHARYDIDGDVAEIVIDNPPLNLWGPELIADIEDGVARAAAERPRALLVRAEGDVFSAGVDVHVFEGLDARSATAADRAPAGPHPRRRGPPAADPGGRRTACA